MKGLQMTLVSSSNLEAVAYDKDNEQLYIKFKSGSVYKYDQVSEDLFNSLLNAESVGKFFKQEIEKSHSYEKIE